MTVFYFTATGNSLAAAKRIGGKLISIPQVIDSGTAEYADDVIGIVFPIYSLRAPKMVRDFLEKVTLKADYIFAVGTYGNMPGAAMHNMRKTALERGYRFDYTASLLMVDNFLPMFEIAKEVRKIPAKKTDEMLSRIVEDIHDRKCHHSAASFGAKVLTSVVTFADDRLSDGKQAQKFIVNENCVHCGICARACPSGNIKVTDRVHFSDRCEGCLGCVHICPKNAIHLKNERSSARWLNPDVSLEEILDSNDRHLSRA